MSLSVDREIMPGVAVGAGFFRSWFGNSTVTDNLNVTPSDYASYCVTAPIDPRLPTSVSGKDICGLADINPDKFGSVHNFVTLASSTNPLTGEAYGKPSEIYKGGDVNITARLPRTVTVSAGWNIGNSAISSQANGGIVTSGSDRCFVVDSPQELFRCKVDPPYQNRLKVNGSFSLPWHLQAAAVYQNLPGINYGATTSFPLSAIQPSLGRPLSGNVTSVSVDLLTPSSAFGSRVNTLDFRLSRFFSTGGRGRLQFNFDIYNLANANPVVNYNNTYSLTGTNRWLTPTLVLDARLAKFSMQLDF